MQIINAQCTRTILNSDGFILAFASAINGQEVTAAISKELTKENIIMILQALGVSQWEELAGTYCRLGIEVTEDGNAELVTLGNIITENWIDVSNKEDITEITEQ